jgi:hypothetical protein
VLKHNIDNTNIILYYISIVLMVYRVDYRMVTVNHYRDAEIDNRSFSDDNRTHLEKERPMHTHQTQRLIVLTTVQYVGSQMVARWQQIRVLTFLSVSGLILSWVPVSALTITMPNVMTQTVALPSISVVSPSNTTMQAPITSMSSPVIQTSQPSMSTSSTSSSSAATANSNSTPTMTSPSAMMSLALSGQTVLNDTSTTSQFTRIALLPESAGDTYVAPDRLSTSATNQLIHLIGRILLIGIISIGLGVGVFLGTLKASRHNRSSVRSTKRKVPARN